MTGWECCDRIRSINEIDLLVEIFLFDKGRIIGENRAWNCSAHVKRRVESYVIVSGGVCFDEDLAVPEKCLRETSLRARATARTASASTAATKIRRYEVLAC
jgi:hypothetical protein